MKNPDFRVAKKLLGRFLFARFFCLGGFLRAEEQTRRAAGQREEQKKKLRFSRHKVIHLLVHIISSKWYTGGNSKQGSSSQLWRHLS